jgi:hypothetical protein
MEGPIVAAAATDRLHYRAADGAAIEVSCRVTGLAVAAIDLTKDGATQTLVPLQ